MPSTNRMVLGEVRRARCEALVETLSEIGDPFSWQLVTMMMRDAKVKKMSMRLPRAAESVEHYEGVALIWAILNLTVTLGIVASSWTREVSPIRQQKAPRSSMTCGTSGP